MHDHFKFLPNVTCDCHFSWEYGLLQKPKQTKTDSKKEPKQKIQTKQQKQSPPQKKTTKPKNPEKQREKKREAGDSLELKV